MAGCTFLTLLLSMAVLTSCGDDKKEEILPEGDPKISFYVVGTVTDPSGAPLQGITMSVKEDYMNFLGYVQMGSTETDEAGKFRTKVFTDATIHNGMVLIAEDPNAAFLNDTLSLLDLPKKKVAAGADMLDGGIWELTGDVLLKPAR